jgi:MFS family permease
MTVNEHVQAVSTEEIAQQPSNRPSLMSALKNRDFRLVWLGESVSLLGDQFYMVALPWLTLQLTGSGLALGTVTAAAGIPRAVFMLVGGAITDRFAPRNVMLISNTMRFILTALLTLLVLTHSIQVWMLYVLAVLFGLVDAFFFPAQSAIVPQIVASDQIESGNALTQITAQLSGFVGPALAGLVIASLSGAANMEALAKSGAAPGTKGIGIAFGFDAVTFLVAMIALWLMKSGIKAVSTQAMAGEQKSLRESIGEGIRIVWNDSILRLLILVTTAINFLFTGPIGVGVPALASKRFVEGAAALGYIMSAFGGGALVGALLAGSLPRPKRIGLISVVLIGAAGIGLALMGVMNDLPLIVGTSAAMGVTVGYVNVLIISWLQKRTQPELMGRVMSLVMLSSFGLGPLSNTIAGVLVDVNLTLLFVVAGGLLIAVTLLAASNRQMRSLTD